MNPDWIKAGITFTAALAISASPAFADPLYELTISGTVADMIVAPSLQGDVDSVFGIGDPFTFVFVYDGASPVTGGSPNTDDYGGAVLSATGSIGGYSYVAPGAANSLIQLYNNVDYNGNSGDHFIIKLSENPFNPIGPYVGTAFPYWLGFVLSDTTSNSFPGAGDPPPLSTDFDFSNFSTISISEMVFYDPVTDNDVAVALLFNVTSVSSQVVPEPTSLALMGLGGFVLTRRRRLK